MHSRELTPLHYVPCAHPSRRLVEEVFTLLYHAVVTVSTLYFFLAAYSQDKTVVTILLIEMKNCLLLVALYGAFTSASRELVERDSTVV